MATNRKLQTEIDRTLKKVAEGIEIFEEILEKIYATTNSNLKEKFEQDLKKEIKKLQRHRDQIKTWISSSEVKDKKALTENRKLIEQQMEKFKACEREIKTKQYSKEGLLAKEKLDPKEAAKMEMSDWMTQMMDKLNTQIDVLEAESEIILAKNKKSKADQNRQKEIEAKLEKHKFHITKLETMLRLMENESLSLEDCESVKDSVEYYVDSNNEPDFLEDDEIYEHLNLLEEEVFGTLDDHHVSNESLPDLDQAPAQPTPAAASSKKKSKDLSAEEVFASPVKSQRGSISSGSSKPATAPATAPVPAKSAPLPTATNAAPTSIKPATAPVVSSKHTTPATGSPVVVAKPSPAPPKYASAVVAEPPKTMAATISAKATPEIKPTSSPLPSLKQAVEKQNIQPPPISFSSIVAAHKQSDEKSTEEKSTNYASQKFFGFPSFMTDLVSTFEAAKSKTYGKGDEVLRNQLLLHILHESLLQCPDLSDTERPSFVQPFSSSNSSTANATTTTFNNRKEKEKIYNENYPQRPMISFDYPNIFEKFDLDTLFFIFYYQQNTRQQILASKELKKQSWRFHKKYLTWFQRHEEPKAITDEFEQGTYIYFDYEGAWCQRKKAEFTFEYRYLEDE